VAVKLVNIPNIGEVKLTKRKGTKQLKLRLSHKGEVIVSMPTWLPFKAGEKFAQTHQEWIEKHRKAPVFLLPNRPIGKTHKLIFAVASSNKPYVKVTEQQVIIKVPIGMTVRSASVQEAAVRGIQKVLKSQEPYLIERIERLSTITGLKYKNLRFGFLKSRWGSCRSDKTITLNYHLLDLTDELINYVIIHELAHTKYMNHSSDFWSLVEKFSPNYKLIRKEVRNVRLGW
jgi:predicted metal-dependent hydrolase